MERKIGEVFEYQGKKLKVMEVTRNLCFDCYFYDGVCCQKTDRECGNCGIVKRTDHKSIMFVEVKDETVEQPQEQVEKPQGLNLFEFLKNYPEGKPFWSPLLGDVRLYNIDEEGEKIVVIAESGVTWGINADATITINGVKSPEIMLYPSREQRDWAKVKYEPKKERFDPKTLNPFDKILVKRYDDVWVANLLSHYYNIIHPEETNISYLEFITISNGIYRHCIPYNDETKHLVGTKDEAPEYYKYWED